MNIHFSTYFNDSNIYPPLVNNEKQVNINSRYAGPTSLLDLLELYTGEVHDKIPDSVRIGYYKRAIKNALGKHPDLYCKKSFETDNRGTAKQLLRWRDELVLTGWQFNCANPELERLYALSVIEEFAVDLPLGINDRWINVYEEINQWDYTLPIHSINVYDPESLILPFFKQLFKILEKKGILIAYVNHESIPISSKGTDLHHFQKAFADHWKNDKISAKNDGSLVIISSETEHVLAEALANYLYNSDMSSDERLLVAGAESEAIEYSLKKYGLPVPVIKRNAVGSAYSTLLFSCTSMIWNDAGPEKISAFLFQNPGPLDSTLARKLYMHFQEFPSIRNERLISLMEEEERNLKKNYKKFSVWLNLPKFETKSGAPPEEIIKYLQLLQKWVKDYIALLQKENKESDKLTGLGQLYKLIEVVELCLKTETDEYISENELNKLIREVIQAQGSENFQREVDSIFSVTHSGNILKPVKEILFWNFNNSDSPNIDTSFWTNQEKETVGRDNFISNQQNIDLWYLKQKNAILNASEKVVLFIPRYAQGRETGSHPLYLNLMNCFEDAELLHHEMSFKRTIPNEQNYNLSIKSYPSKRLPEMKALWKVNPGFPKLRDVESYSSLELLFYHPAEYVLKYLLEIKPVELVKIELSALRKGNLFHHTAEKLWKLDSIQDLTSENLNSEVLKLVDDTIDQEASFLQLSKYKARLIAFRNYAVKGLSGLVEELKKGKWTVESSEQKLEWVQNLGNEELNKLSGYIDLVVTRVNNGEIQYGVFDLKWGGESKRKDNISNCSDLQLVIYEKLLSKDSPVYTAYYIGSKMSVLTVYKELASDMAIQSEVDSSEWSIKIWEKIQKTYTVRHHEITQGKIECGEGLKIEDLKDQAFHLWSADKNEYLIPPNKSNIKEANLYSDYLNILGK